MEYTIGFRTVCLWSLVFLFCARYGASNPAYDRLPDLTRRVPQKLEPPGCSYKGQKFEHGEQVETPEPCLNCTCIKAVLVCYLRVCPTAVAPPPGCFPAREPGQCCPTLVCVHSGVKGERQQKKAKKEFGLTSPLSPAKHNTSGFSDVNHQLGGDTGGDVQNDAYTNQEDSPDLRPTFKPSTASEVKTTPDTMVEVDESMPTKDELANLHSTRHSETFFDESLSTLVPKYKTTTGSVWKSDSGTNSYQANEFNNHQKLTTAYGEITDQFASESPTTELDTSASREPSTTWFTVPDAIARVTITVEDLPSSSESSEAIKVITNLDKSTESTDLYSSTLMTSAAPTKGMSQDFNTKNTDSLLFVSSTMASLHDHFADYDLSFLNDIPGGCLLNGTLYGDGSAMLSSSFCEYCFCIRGKQTCLKPKCHLAIEGCVAKYDNEYTCCPSRYDCSEREKLIEASLLEISSSEASTTIGQLGEEGECQVGKNTYAVGDVVPHYQSCHNCYCNHSDIVCHKISCSPSVDGCQPIIPAGKCCPISYRCDLPQADASAMGMESNNDIPPPSKLEIEIKSTTTEKTTDDDPKGINKPPSIYAVKTIYSNRVKGHPKPAPIPPENYLIKTPNRKQSLLNRLKHPSSLGGQKANGMKNAIHRRIDEFNSTIYESDGSEIPDFDQGNENADTPELHKLSSKLYKISVGEVYTENALRQSRHDTTISESTKTKYEDNSTEDDQKFVTKSMEENSSAISSRGNDKTLDIDNFDIGSFVVSTMRAISTMRDGDLPFNKTLSESFTSSQTTTNEKSATNDETSSTHQDGRISSFVSTDFPEVQTISLEELFKKFIKTAVNTTATGPTYQGNKNGTSSAFRNNSKQPLNMDKDTLKDEASNYYVYKTDSTLTDVTKFEENSKDFMGNSSDGISSAFTPTADYVDYKKESSLPISKDPLLDFETRPISLESTSSVPEPVYLLAVTTTTVSNSTSNASHVTEEHIDDQTDSQNNAEQPINEFMADQPKLVFENKDINMKLWDTHSSTKKYVDDDPDTSKTHLKETANVTSHITIKNEMATKTPLLKSSVTNSKPVTSEKTDGMWTLISTSIPPIELTSKIEDTTTLKNTETEIKPMDDVSSTETSVITEAAMETTTATISLPATRKNSKLPVEILAPPLNYGAEKANKTPERISPQATKDLMTASSKITITSIAHDINSSSSVTPRITTTTQMPYDVPKKDLIRLPKPHKHSSDDGLDDEDDDDYVYLSDDNLDDLDFLSNSHNDDVFEFLSSFPKTDVDLSTATTAEPTVIDVTSPLQDSNHVTNVPENFGTIKISAPISVIDPNSTQNPSSIQDIFDSKNKLRTTESDGVIYMDPKFTDIKIEIPELGRNENVSVIPHVTEVFELPGKTSTQTETKSPVAKIDGLSSQYEKKKEPRIQDTVSQIEADDRQGNTNFKVIPFVVADALKGNQQNRTQTVVISQDQTLTTEDVVTDFCFISGRLYINGEMIPKTDPCELCRCFYGRELCQLQRCPAPPAADCVPEYLQGFCCPRLTCGKNGAPENPGAEQVSVPLKRHHAVRPPNLQANPMNSQVPQGSPIRPHTAQIRPTNHQQTSDQSKPSVIIHQPPFRQGTPYRPPQSQQPDRFLLDSQRHKQGNEVRPNIQLNLPVPPSRTSSKDEIATQAPTAPPLKYGLRVRPQTMTVSTPSQEATKWTPTSTRVTRSTTMSRAPSTSHMTESSTPPFRRQSTSRKSPMTTTTTTAATTTSRITQKPLTSTTPTLPTTAYEASQSGFVDPWGLLKVSGCNIYGKFYNVNERVEVLSGPCSHCICAPNGVECNDIC